MGRRRWWQNCFESMYLRRGRIDACIYRCVLAQPLDSNWFCRDHLSLLQSFLSISYLVYCYYQVFASANTAALPFMPSIKVGRTGNAPGVLGNALASTTLNPIVPLTLNFESSTAKGLLSPPIEHELVA